MPASQQADVVIEKEFKTAAVHQAYIEPHACVARWDADGQTEIWSSSQGHFQMRALTAQILQKPVGDIRVYPAEIGGGFGGKTVTYLEPVATLLSMKSGQPGAADDDPRGRVPRHRPDLGFVDVGEDRRHEGRQDRRRRWRLQVPGRRLPRLAGDERLPVRVRAVRHRRTSARSATTWCATGRSRRRIARPARRSPPSRWRACSTCARRRSAWTRWNCGSRTPARIGTPTIFGPKHAHDGYVADARGAAEPSGLQGEAGQEPGARRRLRLLVQRRRRFERHDPGERRRHRAGGDRQPGHRRLARLDGDHGGRDAGRGLQRRCARSSPTPGRSATRT